MSRDWKPGDAVVATLNGKVRLLRYEGPVKGLPWVMDKTYDPVDYVASNWDIGDPQLVDVAFVEPAKPDEPTGLGAVVEDAFKQRWVRMPLDADPWCNWDDTTRLDRTYAEIDAVRVLSEGVAE